MQHGRETFELRLGANNGDVGTEETQGQRCTIRAANRRGEEERWLVDYDSRRDVRIVVLDGIDIGRSTNGTQLYGLIDRQNRVRHSHTAAAKGCRIVHETTRRRIRHDVGEAVGDAVGQGGSDGRIQGCQLSKSQGARYGHCPCQIGHGLIGQQIGKGARHHRKCHRADVGTGVFRVDEECIGDRGGARHRQVGDCVVGAQRERLHLSCSAIDSGNRRRAGVTRSHDGGGSSCRCCGAG